MEWVRADAVIAVRVDRLVKTTLDFAKLIFNLFYIDE